MTGQDLLDRMELVNQELQLQSGEDDVVRGLIALNVAQDYFETFAAARGKIFGSTVGTITTSDGVETTDFPTGVMRIDRLQYIDASGVPGFDLSPIRKAGGHATGGFWPLSLAYSTTTGVPRAYWTNGRKIYWTPSPSGTSTIRWYGFQRAADITADGEFTYEDAVSFPIASFAVRLMKIGVDDEGTDAAQLAQEAFKGVLDQLALANRDGAVSLEYTVTHEA